MGARRSYPQFEHLNKEELVGLLRLCKISPTLRKATLMAIGWPDMPLVDIAAQFDVDRTTISRRINSIAIPEMERILRMQGGHIDIALPPAAGDEV